MTSTSPPGREAQGGGRGQSAQGTPATAGTQGGHAEGAGELAADERSALVELVSELRASVSRHLRAGRWAASAAASPRLQGRAALVEEEAPAAVGTAASAPMAMATAMPAAIAPTTAPTGLMTPTSVEAPSGPRDVPREGPRGDGRHDVRAEARAEARADSRDVRSPSRGPGDPDLSRFDDIPVDDMGPPSDLPDFGDAPGFGDYGDFADAGPPAGMGAPRGNDRSNDRGNDRGADRINDRGNDRSNDRGRSAPSRSAAASSGDRGRAPLPVAPAASLAPPAPALPFAAPEPQLVHGSMGADGEPLPRGKKTLATIRADLGDCQRCKLAKSRNKIVFGTGAPDASLVFVGEAPGADEDRTGEPFVGRAGQLLDKMIEAMGWSRQSVYIANLLKCRPPNNRNPEADEAAACRPFLVSQLEVLAPRIIVALGRPSANALLSMDAPIGSLRGKFHERMGLKIMPTFHPAFLLRDPNRKRDAWADLQLVMTELTRIGVTPRR